MRLLWFNLATDTDDRVLGFTTSWIRAVADLVEFIHVMTMRTGSVSIPANVRVHSIGKERGFSEARRAVEFYRILWNILRRDRIDACFSHMSPVFTVMAGPILRAARIPIVTWFAHPQRSLLLVAAHGLSTRMVTSLQTSYPYRRDKLDVLGQGVDTLLFAPHPETVEARPPTILSVGRISPAKNLETLLRAAARLRQIGVEPFRVTVVGDPARDVDAPYRDQLVGLRDALGLRDMVHFEPAVRHEMLPSWYRESAVHVNLSATGFGDKVALEAMACGRPCIVTNEGFSETLGIYRGSLLARSSDAEDLAVRLRRILALTAEQRAEIGAYLRFQVQRLHSLRRLAESLAGVLQSSIDGMNAAVPTPL